MAGLNIDALKGLQKNYDSRGNNKIFYQKQIGEETDIRILPPHDHMNGIWHIEQIVWWINNKSYISPATFGEPCPIEAEVELAKTVKGDEGLLKLLNHKDFKKSSNFLFPILFLNPPDDSNNMTVVDNMVKIASFTSLGLIKAINKIITSRPYQNGTPDGIMDRVKGRNFILTRQKTGSRVQDVEYSAQADAIEREMDEKWYKDIPDVMTYTKMYAYTDDYLTGIIQNYLWGYELPADNEKNKRFPGITMKTSTQPDQQATRTAGSRRPGSTPTPAAEEKADNTTVTESRRLAAAQQAEEKKEPIKRARPGTRRSVADDISDVQN